MVVLNSALTDFAAILADPRWDTAQMEEVVGGVVVMSGVAESEAGVGIDKSAQNNAFDLESATAVFDHFQSKQTSIPFVVVTRHSASACQLPRSAFDGSSHPFAVRLTTVAKPSLQKLWERSHRTKEERDAVKDALPMRCDAAWFRATFLEATTPTELTGKDDIWPYVKARAAALHASRPAPFTPHPSHPSLLSHLTPLTPQPSLTLNPLTPHPSPGTGRASTSTMASLPWSRRRSHLRCSAPSSGRISARRTARS